MERQTRALSDINDNTKKSAQHAAAWSRQISLRNLVVP
jgi:hypothetical protein